MGILADALGTNPASSLIDGIVDVLTQLFQDLWQVIKDTLSALFDDAVFDTWQEWFSQHLGKVTLHMTLIVNVFSSYFSLPIKPTPENALKVMHAEWCLLYDIAVFIEPLLSGILAWIVTVIDLVRRILLDPWTILYDLLYTIIGGILQMIWNLVVNIIELVFDLLLNTVTALINAVKAIVNGIASAVNAIDDFLHTIDFDFF